MQSGEARRLWGDLGAPGRPLRHPGENTNPRSEGRGRVPALSLMCCVTAAPACPSGSQCVHLGNGENHSLLAGAWRPKGDCVGAQCRRVPIGVHNGTAPSPGFEPRCHLSHRPPTRARGGGSSSSRSRALLSSLMEPCKQARTGPSLVCQPTL